MKENFYKMAEKFLNDKYSLFENESEEKIFDIRAFKKVLSNLDDNIHNNFKIEDGNNKNGELEFTLYKPGFDSKHVKITKPISKEELLVLIKKMNKDTKDYIWGESELLNAIDSIPEFKGKFWVVGRRYDGDNVYIITYKENPDISFTVEEAMTKKELKQRIEETFKYYENIKKNIKKVNESKEIKFANHLLRDKNELLENESEEKAFNIVSLRKLLSSFGNIINNKFQIEFAPNKNGDIEFTLYKPGFDSKHVKITKPISKEELSEFITKIEDDTKDYIWGKTELLKAINSVPDFKDKFWVDSEKHDGEKFYIIGLKNKENLDMFTVVEEALTKKELEQKIEDLIKNYDRRVKRIVKDHT